MAAADGDLMHSGTVWGDFAAEWDAPNLVLANGGAVHAELRGVQKPGFARGRMLHRLPQAAGIVREHLAALRPGQCVALVPLIQGIVADQLGEILIGRRPGAALADIRTMQRTALNVLVVRRWPRIALRTSAYHRARARVLALAESLIAERARRPEAATERDLIDDLLAARTRRPAKVATIFFGGSRVDASTKRGRRASLWSALGWFRTSHPRAADPAGAQ